MSQHLHRDMESLKRQLLELAAMVETEIGKSILALTDRRLELAEAVRKGGHDIDAKEVHIEEECLKILALHQPVATDLRFIVAALKVNNDLERMGDLAINIAERACFLLTHDPIGVPLDFPEMAEAVRKMVKGSLDALIQLDTVKARQVMSADDEVDELNRDMFTTLQEVMREHPDTVERAMHQLSASRHLERIADLATNIAEDVVFMVEGEVVRHRPEDFRENS